MAAEETLAGWAGLLEGLKSGIEKGSEKRTEAERYQAAKKQQAAEFAVTKAHAEAQLSNQARILAMQEAESARSAEQFQREKEKFDLEMDRLRRNQTTHKITMIDPRTGERETQELPQEVIDQITAQRYAGILQAADKVRVTVGGREMLVDPKDAVEIQGQVERDYQSEVSQVNDLLGTLYKVFSQPVLDKTGLSVLKSGAENLMAAGPVITAILKQRFPRLAVAGYFDQITPLPGSLGQPGPTGPPPLTGPSGPAGAGASTTSQPGFVGAGPDSFGPTMPSTMINEMQRAALEAEVQARLRRSRIFPYGISAPAESTNPGR